MSYLHCHKCGWEQDDFWEENGWSPLYPSHIEELRTYLLKNVILLDGGRTIMDSKDYVIQHLERIIAKIKGMRWKTLKEWQDTPKEKRMCPRCGSTDDWDID